MRTHQHKNFGGAWATRQNRDPYVKRAREQGLRARSVFKLEQMDDKYNLIKPTSKIIDLGAAPGSWSQYAVAQVAGKNQLVAVDCLLMQPIERVRFVQGDFCVAETQQRVVDCFAGDKIDLVLSDMAPNVSGIASTDQARMERLQQAVLEFCQHQLKPGGALLTKLFAGESFAAIRKQIGDCFAQAQTIKPDASRAQSREIYLLARGYKNSGEFDRV